MSRSLEKHLDRTVGPKRILSLSGGGVRGLITLGALGALEALLKSEMDDPDARLCDHFDLFAGTSTGSIIATALALGWSVAEIKTLYYKLCPVLFKPNRRLGFFAPRYDARHLRKMLEAKLRDEKGDLLRLGSDQLRSGLMICAKRMDTDSAWILTNHPGSKFYNAEANQTWMPNKLFTLSSLVQASAAAPSYLEPVMIDVAKDEPGFKDDPALFVDGAISGHNCPALMAFQVATLDPYAFRWKTGEDHLSILSIGTGQYRSMHSATEFRDMRTVNQALAALTGLISESQRGVLLTMQSLSNPREGTSWPINSEIEGLDGVTLTKEPLFNFRHVDAELSNESLKKHLNLHGESGRKLDKICTGMRDMANGRRKNLIHCEQLGVSIGGELTREDLFL